MGDADRAGDIVDRIRAHMKKAPPPKEHFDLNVAINEVLLLARSAIIRNGVSFQTRLAMADARQAGAHRPAVALRNGDWGLVETAPATARSHSTAQKIGILTGKLLSERERNIINLMAQGNSDKEIARSLAISPETVKTYVTRIFVKLNVYKRTRAVALAQNLGIVNTY